MNISGSAASDGAPLAAVTALSRSRTNIVLWIYARGHCLPGSHTFPAHFIRFLSGSPLVHFWIHFTLYPQKCSEGVVMLLPPCFTLGEMQFWSHQTVEISSSWLQKPPHVASGKQEPSCEGVLSFRRSPIKLWLVKHSCCCTHHLSESQPLKLGTRSGLS